MNISSNKVFDVLIMVSLLAAGLLLLSQLNNLNLSEVYKQDFQHEPIYTNVPVPGQSGNTHNTLNSNTSNLSNLSSLNLSKKSNLSNISNLSSLSSKSNVSNISNSSNTSLNYNASNSYNSSNDIIVSIEPIYVPPPPKTYENTGTDNTDNSVDNDHHSTQPKEPENTETTGNTDNTNNNNDNTPTPPTNPEDVNTFTGTRAIVYLLPKDVCSPKWTNKYGDRIFFYTYADLNDYKKYIDQDFGEIEKVYNTVIIVLPADDTDKYFSNLKIINNLAKKHNLNVIFAIFPNEKYGNEEQYLFDGTKMHALILNDMKFMSKLSQTKKVAVWYGWTYRAKGSDILSFYATLPDSLKNVYALWLDEEYIKKVDDVSNKLPSSLLVITEWYQPRGLCGISVFKNQMIVTGYSDAKDSDEWVNGVRLVMNKERKKCGRKLDFGIWDYYDKKDGAGEDLSAYFNTEPHLVNPWN